MYKSIHTIQDRKAFKKNASCRAKLLCKTFPCPNKYNIFSKTYKDSHNIANILINIFQKARVPESYINNIDLCYIIFNSITSNEFATVECQKIWKLKLECIGIKPGHVLRILDTLLEI